MIAHSLNDFIIGRLRAGPIYKELRQAVGYKKGTNTDYCRVLYNLLYEHYARCENPLSNIEMQKKLTDLYSDLIPCDAVARIILSAGWDYKVDHMKKPRGMGEVSSVLSALAEHDGLFKDYSSESARGYVRYCTDAFSRWYVSKEKENRPESAELNNVIQIGT